MQASPHPASLTGQVPLSGGSVPQLLPGQLRLPCRTLRPSLHPAHRGAPAALPLRPQSTSPRSALCDPQPPSADATWPLCPLEPRQPPKASAAPTRSPATSRDPPRRGRLRESPHGACQQQVQPGPEETALASSSAFWEGARGLQGCEEAWPGPHCKRAEAGEPRRGPLTASYGFSCLLAWGGAGGKVLAVRTGLSERLAGRSHGRLFRNATVHCGRMPRRAACQASTGPGGGGREGRQRQTAPPSHHKAHQ